jgi:hypothetical protein
MRKLPHVTNRAAVEVRGVYGQSVLDFHEQIRRLLLQETKNVPVGEFFAEPQVNSLRGEIGWYTNAEGPIQRISELSEADRDGLWQKLEAIRDQIKLVGEKYAAQGGQSAGTRIDTFRAMLSTTGIDDCLFSVGGQPVLCEWGCNPLGEGTKPVDLWTIGARRVEQVPEPAVVTNPKVDSGDAPPPERNTVPIKQKLVDEKASVLKSAPEPIPSNEPQIEIPKRQFEPKFEKVESQRAVEETGKTLHDKGRFNDNERSGTWWNSGAKFGSSGFFVLIWNILKYLILLGLCLLLLGVLLRGCSEASHSYSSSDTATQAEEELLRREISTLRQKAHDIALTCDASLAGSSVIQRVQREGRNMSGDLSVALKWNGTHDLDLYVSEPSGKVTGVGVPEAKASVTGGGIALDMNFLKHRNSMSSEPVEVVKWEKSAPSGTYKVGVRLFRATHDELQSAPSIEYHLVVQRQGNKVTEKTGIVPVSADCKNSSDQCKVTEIASFDLK